MGSVRVGDGSGPFGPLDPDSTTGVAAGAAPAPSQVSDTAAEQEGAISNTPVDSGLKRAEQNLDSTLGALLVNMSFGGASRATPAPSQLLPDPVQDPAFLALPTAVRDKLTQDMANVPGTTGQLQQIMSDPLYSRLSAADQTKLLNVFAASDPGGRAALPDLMQRRVVAGSGNPPATTPALLSGDNTSSRTSLLDNLNNLATQQLDSAVAGRRDQLLGQVIQTAADPGKNVSQGQAGVCGYATIEMRLLLSSPSEYARLVGGLTSPSRSVTLANGAQLDAAKNDTAANPTLTTTSGHPPTTNTGPDSRTIPDRVLQSAFQQFGMRSTSKNPGSVVVDANVNPSGSGGDQQVNTISAIFDRSFTISGVVGSAEAAQLTNRIQSELNHGLGPVGVGLNWDSGGGKHAVLVTDMRDGRVFFRNPWGSRDQQGTGYSDGVSLSSPPRRVEDSQSGLESMSIKDFQQYLDAAVIGPPVGGK